MEKPVENSTCGPAHARHAAVTLACVFMASADVRHPPGGATALLAVVGGEPIARMGWLYPMCPIFLGTCWLLLIASLRRHVSRSLERGSDPRKLSHLIRGDLDWIVMKALEKKRSQRFASASEFRAEVERHLRHEPLLVAP